MYMHIIQCWMCVCVCVCVCVCDVSQITSFIEMNKQIDKRTAVGSPAPFHLPLLNGPGHILSQVEHSRPRAAE